MKVESIGNTPLVSDLPEIARKLSNSKDQEKVQTNTEKVQTNSEKVPPEQTEKALKEVKSMFNQMVKVGFEYSVDKETNREVIKIINQESGELIRQIPAEEILNMVEKIHEMLGFLFDKKF